jgi:HEAT repeat protein
LNSADEDVSSKAEMYLMRYYGARALDELIGACNHSNPVVRFRAVWALAHTKDPRIYETILRLTDDPDERVRYDATLAFGVLGDMRAVPQLMRMWPEHDETRPAAEAISKLGVKTLPAVEKVHRGGDVELRREAVNVIGGFAKNDGNKRAIKLLRASLNDPDSIVREDARYWLEEIGIMQRPNEEGDEAKRNRGKIWSFLLTS